MFITLMSLTNILVLISYLSLLNTIVKRKVFRKKIPNTYSIFWIKAITVNSFPDMYLFSGYKIVRLKVIPNKGFPYDSFPDFGFPDKQFRIK